MASIKVTIHTKNSSRLDSQTVVLKEALVKKLNIPTQHSVTLQFGSMKQEVRVVPAARPTSLRMSESLAGTFNLTHGDKLSLNYRPDTQTIRIGPLIGVMISRVTSQTPDRPFGSNTAFCRELSLACAKLGGMVYFFTPEDLPIQGDRLNGWVYRSQWSKASFPVPDCVYNRLTTRKLENSAKVQQMIREIKTRYHSSIFNEKYLNKTEVFHALKQVPAMRVYLPESYSFSGFDMLKSMCNKHSIVFLKPVTGSLGKGIIRISRSANGYHCHFNQSVGMRKLSFPTLKKLYSAISGRLRKSKYQIQQGLRLIDCAGRPIDFRALVQKNKKGSWSVTSIVGRIAGSNNFVSNLARGGSLTSVGNAIARSNLASQGRASAHLKLRKAALAIAVGLDDKIPEHFGELGVDLALDIQGRVWLLEVNSKPSKEDNSALVQTKIRPSVKRIVEYAQHLAKT
ncbi:YheC/YheD family protein [Paenibacillus sp. 32O-W]|uniref:YheC/YheD family endospore coat-associated protein n=1 Tax=Paenibacillus sp. 32O-W TaxID=1695218 RepID=UPI0011A355F8|nr:YheC/YheD family protein [Paenibacillus sp. 32O-W]